MAGSPLNREFGGMDDAIAEYNQDQMIGAADKYAERFEGGAIPMTNLSAELRAAFIQGALWERNKVKETH